MHASNGFSDGFLDLPERPGKPRETGLTHVIDKGLNLRDIEGMFDVGGAFVDIVKLGWGTSYVTNNLEKKIALYRSFETPVVCGGTLFEAPNKGAQAWFVRKFGPEVNLGNIPPEEVIPLETLRLGLRADTLKEVLLGDQPAAPVAD